MPLKQCTNKNGINGWSWGNGNCLVGKDAKKKAIKMGIAIEGPKKFAQIMKNEGMDLSDVKTHLFNSASLQKEDLMDLFDLNEEQYKLELLKAYFEKSDMVDLEEMRCPDCNTLMDEVDNSYKCPDCGYQEEF